MFFYTTSDTLSTCKTHPLLAQKSHVLNLAEEAGHQDPRGVVGRKEYFADDVFIQVEEDK